MGLHSNIPEELLERMLVMSCPGTVRDIPNLCLVSREFRRIVSNSRFLKHRFCASYGDVISDDVLLSTFNNSWKFVWKVLLAASEHSVVAWMCQSHFFCAHNPFSSDFSHETMQEQMQLIPFLHDDSNEEDRPSSPSVAANPAVSKIYIPFQAFRQCSPTVIHSIEGLVIELITFQHAQRRREYASKLLREAKARFIEWKKSNPTEDEQRFWDEQWAFETSEILPLDETSTVSSTRSVAGSEY
jgi:hypothetical protein